MKAIGLMSGTSADGVDAALVDIKESGGKISVSLVAFISQSYPTILQKRILAASEPGGGSTAEIAELNVEIGEAFARAAISVCEKAKIDMSEVEFIGSHGQTVAHLPGKFATLQIGEPAVIAARAGVKVVADFRHADLARGGQGAPLTPIADYHFFRHPKKTRVIVNIGGITNVTVLPAGIKSESDIIGFDSGFGNMPLDGMARIISGGKLNFDKGGKLAASGKCNDLWKDIILAHPFFEKKPPKSAGREEFGAKYVEKLIARFKADTRKKKIDLLTTLTFAVAYSIANSVLEFVMPLEKIDKFLICGGGAKNRLIMEYLKMFTNGAVAPTDKFGIPADAREAMAFALLGYLTLQGRPGSVPNVTGASSPAVLGKTVSP